MKKKKCWYCGEKPRVDDESLFCKDCEKIEKKDNQSSTYIIYNTM